MAKKEFKIGEIFQFGLVKLKCRKAKLSAPYCRCEDCYIFKDSRSCPYQLRTFLGNCNGEKREDKTSVIFVKVRE